jgi:ABC-type glutathione transport system ATPase component
VRAESKWCNQEARALFEARAKTSGMFILSQDLAFARKFCDMGLVLDDGELRLFEDVEQAIAFAAEAPRRAVLEKRRAARKARRKRLREKGPRSAAQEERRAARQLQKSRLARPRE